MAILSGYAVDSETGGQTAGFPGDDDSTLDRGPLPVTDDHPPVEAEARALLDREAQVPIELASVGDLVRGAADGDQRAWRELVARFSGMIAAVGRRYGLSPADVGELQQTTWLRLVEHCSRIEHPERVGGWLATTARRESLQLLKRAARYTTGADELLANLPNNNAPELDAGPLADERNAMLRAGWAKLKPRCQELLSLLLADEGMAYKDLSELLSMPVGSIGPTRMRCLEHLKRLVAEDGLTHAG
jgi:RNA polymerase sigma factor (sigma-70 family)